MSERSPDQLSGTLALGLLCSVPATLPALMRVAPVVPPAPAALALLGAGSLVVVPLGMWVRRAIAARLPPADRALACGTALSALPLALFGGVLKSTTHHRPLGGATFAVAALCLLTLCIGLSFRIFRRASGGAVSSTWQNLFTLTCGLSLGCAIALGLAPGAHSSLVDFLALLGGAVVAGWLELPRWLRRVRFTVALAAWLTLLVCAVALLQSPRLSSASVAAIRDRAPVTFAALSWLGAGS